MQLDAKRAFEPFSRLDEIMNEFSYFGIMYIKKEETDEVSFSYSFYTLSASIRVNFL